MILDHFRQRRRANLDLIVHLTVAISVSLAVSSFVWGVVSINQMYVNSRLTPILRQYPEINLECVFFDNRILNCWKLEK